MTEIEAKKILDGIDEVCGDLPEDGDDVEIALMMAKDALAEIQQYRAIGTIEEFKALKEKNEPKKVVLQGYAFLCPICQESTLDGIGLRSDYCPKCGQKLDWQ